MFGAKAPFTQGCDLRATFERPEDAQDAQWSPKPRKCCFCVTAAARPLCLPWMTKSAVVAQQVAQRRQSGGRTIAKVAEELPWSPDGDTVVATVIAQWTLLVGQRRHNGGTRKAEALLKLIHNAHNSTYFSRDDQWPTTVHPFCHHGDVCAFPLPPSSDLWATNLLGDLCATFEHVQNFTATIASMAMSDRPVYQQGNRSACFLPSTATWPVLWPHNGGRKVAAPV